MILNGTNTDKIKITIEYKHHTFTLDTFKYKTLSYIKDKIYTHFYPIRSDINLYYMNKNLSGFEMHSLGFFFKNQNKVTIQVKEINYINPNSLSERKYYLNSSSDNVITPIPSHPHSKAKVVLPHIISKYSKANMNMNTSLSNESYFSNCSYKHKKLFQSKSQNVFMKIRANHSSNENIDITCNECFLNKVSFYCRTCHIFICNECLLSVHGKSMFRHHNHQTFHLENNDDNYIRTIAKYKDALCDELNKVKYEYANVEYKQEGEIDLAQWKDKLLNEVNTVINVASNINEDISNKHYSDSSDIETAQKRIDLIEIDKYKDPFEVFENINKVEKDIDVLCTDSYTLHKQTHVSNKIDMLLQLFNTEMNELKQSLQTELNKL